MHISLDSGQIFSGEQTNAEGKKDAHQSYQDASREERRNLVTNVLLTLIFISTYSTSMIISELYFPIPENIFMFILLKFIVGLSHHLLGKFPTF